MIQQRVAEFLSRFLSETGTAEIWVACSGGLDSMALLSLVREFADRADIPAGVVHLNHGLRSESRDDELFVAAHALNLSLPMVVGQVRNLREQARCQHLSLETAARQVRYAFFQRFLKEREAAVIVTAHNATDQVETILMNLMRGAGLRGVKGIPRRRGRIGRPLLQVTREGLADYVSRNRIAYREDPTNSSLEFSRNRVRHELLPIIRKLGGSGVEERMAGAGLRLAADLTIIDGRLDDLWSQVQPERVGLTVERVLLQKCEIALLPHFLGRMIRRAGAVKQVSSRVLDDLCGLVGSPGERRESRYDLGGGLVFRALPETIFIGMGEKPRGSDGGMPEYQLALPDFGLYPLPNDLGALRIKQISAIDYLPELKKQAEKQRFLEVVDGDQLDFPLQIRNRRPGDRFQPLGLHGRSCKLKNFLADRHLSRFARSALPLLLDQKGRIVWVVGERLDHRFRITAESRSYVELRFE
ncbi:MAG: tRNA lysidine(34) synthetase TilS [Pseudomonadota bacterium]|nr:tRNA lysidine(34) synthetase TilS [Pseudomonadota bacterium]